MKNIFLKINKKNVLTIGLLVGLYLFFYIMLVSGQASNQFKSLIIPISYNIIMAVSLNLMVGILGELSLGHAGFMAVGAYLGSLTSILLTEHFPELPMYVYLPIAMLAGGIAAALFGVLIGIPALRVKGDYLAIVTLAFGEIIRNLIVNIDALGGAIGLDTKPIVPRTKLQLTLLPYLAIAVILTTVLILNLNRSKHGRSITAIRDNRIAAEACGINANYYKVLVFAISAFFAGVAGTLYGHSNVLINSNTFSLNMSIETLVMVVLGGMGNIPGSIISAIVLTALPELLREFADLRMLIYSIALIVIMLITSAPGLALLREKLTFGYWVNYFKARKARKEGTNEQ